MENGRLAFTIVVNTEQLYVLDPVNGDVRRLTIAPGDQYQPTQSPDGTQIAFSTTRDGNSEIYVMNADGSEPRLLSHGSAKEGEPSWSPDGEKIAFDRYRFEGYGENDNPLYSAAVCVNLACSVA